MRCPNGIRAPVILASFVFASVGFGKAIDQWSYSKLFAESDLIVIASPVASEANSAEIDTNNQGIILKGVVTRFKVHQLLKGAEKGEVKVLHYRLESSEPILITPPSTLDFMKAKGNEKSAQGKVSSEYMLFLKKGKDGLFQFVSGYDQPEHSVKEIKDPKDIVE